MNRISLKSIGTGIAVLVFLLVLLVVGRSLNELNRHSRDSGLLVAREAVERAVIQCYALEGVYPPNLAYLEENYGLIVNDDQYMYLYEVVGSNVHPIIDVRFLEDVTS